MLHNKFVTMSAPRKMACLLIGGSPPFLWCHLSLATYFFLTFLLRLRRVWGKHPSSRFDDSQATHSLDPNLFDLGMLESP